MEVDVGLVYIRDLLAGEERRQALLPEVVTAFDFSLGVRSGSVAKADSVEAQCPAQLGQGFWDVSEEQTMVINIDFQRQATFGESGGQEVEVSQEIFALIDFGAGEDSAAIIEHVQQREELLAARKPAVGRGIQLPQFSDLTALPALNRSRRTVIRLRMSKLMFNGPAPDLRTSKSVPA